MASENPQSQEDAGQINQIRISKAKNGKLRVESASNTHIRDNDKDNKSISSGRSKHASLEKENHQISK